MRARDRRKLRRSFPALEDAIAWRDSTCVGVRNRTVVTPTSTTFRDYAERWLDGARNGTNLTRDLSPYKPSTCRAYSKHIRRIYLALGDLRLAAVELRDLQNAANGLRRPG